MVIVAMWMKWISTKFGMIHDGLRVSYLWPSYEVGVEVERCCGCGCAGCDGVCVCVRVRVRVWWPILGDMAQFKILQICPEVAAVWLLRSQPALGRLGSCGTRADEQPAGIEN
jgi:hypothetical protein